MLQVEILYIETDPDWQTALEVVQRVLSDLSLEAQVSSRLVASDREAGELEYVGSTTIWVNGRDLFPVEGATHGHKLRSYFTDEGMLGYPSYTMLHEALSPLAA